jgi:hypothetical protein
MKYVRKWKCAMCDEPVIIDTKAFTQSCGCSDDPRPSERVQDYIKTLDFRENYEVLCL